MGLPNASVMFGPRVIEYEPARYSPTPLKVISKSVAVEPLPFMGITPVMSPRRLVLPRVKAAIWLVVNELIRTAWLKVTWTLGIGGGWLPVGLKAVTAGGVTTMVNVPV